jgi:hypothetical protein
MSLTRVWRCGNYGSVASVLIEKPAIGDFLLILDGGFSLQYSPLMEYREGRGMVLFCQMDVTDRTEHDPAAQYLIRNMFQYLSGRRPMPERKALYMGEPASKCHLEASGVAVAPYDGGPLSAQQVLIAGPRAGQELAAVAPRLSAWLQAGGHLLAIGVDQDDARRLLPFPVTMSRAEHIASGFPPFGSASALAGIGPADVYNRSPYELPLVSRGATVIGDGVLAQQSSVVFLQLVPWRFDYEKQYNPKRTFRRSSFTLNRILAGMGVRGVTPLLTRIGTPVSPAETTNRCLVSLYLDRPEEWDDPYRFFRW